MPVPQAVHATKISRSVEQFVSSQRGKLQQGHSRIRVAQQRQSPNVNTRNRDRVFAVEEQVLRPTAWCSHSIKASRGTRLRQSTKLTPLNCVGFWLRGFLFCLVLWRWRWWLCCACAFYVVYDPHVFPHGLDYVASMA
jgi:hypothetical protein